MDTDIFGFNWWITTVVAALIINLASSYLKPVVDTFFRYLSATTLNRQIKAAEAELAHLDKFAKSENRLVPLGFTAIFALFGLVALMSALETLSPSNQALVIPKSLLWILVAAISIYLAGLFHKIAEYPKSRERIETQIQKLKRQLPGDRKVE